MTFKFLIFKFAWPSCNASLEEIFLYPIQPSDLLLITMQRLELWISQTIERIVLKFWIEQEFQATILDKEFLSKATFLLLIEAFKDNYEHNFKLCLAYRRELSSEEQNLNFHNQAVLLIHRTHNIDCLT